MPNATPQVAVVVVSCSCGMYPLADAMHLTSGQAWQAAARHVALNPTLCKPTMHRSHAPAGIALYR